MRLSINKESVVALREFASKIPIIINNINEDTEQLISAFNQVSEEIGPHVEDFYQMLKQVQKKLEETAPSVIEVSYMLNNTADRMESYINHGSPTASATLAETVSIREKYDTAILDRLNRDSTNPNAARLYNEYANQIRIVDYDFLGTPFYNSLSKSIKLNAMADLHNPTGNMSTYFHEVGHMLDDAAGNGHSWLSSDPDFRACLERDVNVYVNNVMVNKHCDQETAYDYISDEIASDWCANVSDIFGSLTGCRCQGDWGHSRQYWEADSSNVTKEAFANMFESSIGSSEKVEMMRKYFPTAYAKFESLLRSAL